MALEKANSLVVQVSLGKNGKRRSEHDLDKSFELPLMRPEKEGILQYLIDKAHTHLSMFGARLCGNYSEFLLLA